ncbi:uncharacterized protein LOC125787587 [Astyanax mexicanus]|uniref:uncharacterized protein LOC125787587 n=1 Tax=Astyanax mexicanus TaxID=7994 RepID=UPI0020CB3383|nr:uncharacterized protein LOC125787587 [Astyanax mexicanus]
MALIILLFLHLILEVHPQYLPQPFLSVFPAVITQNGSVMLDCGADKTLYQCYFYPKGQDENTTLSSSCQLSLTGSELMWWTGRSSGSPEPVNMICFYSKKATAGSRPSDHSLPVAVLILDQKPTISLQYDFQRDEFTAVCEIQLSRSVIAEFRCELYTGDLQFLKGESQKSGFEKLNCIFTASKNDLFRRLHSAKSREVSCDYSLKSHPSTRSPRSDKYDISVVLPIPTQPSTTQQKSTTAPPVSSTHKSTSKDPTTSVAPNTTCSTRAPDIAPVITQVTQQNPTDPPKNETTARTITTFTTSVIPTSTGVLITDSTGTRKREKSPATGLLLVTAVSVTGISVFLGGVMIIVLCSFIKKQQSRKRFKVNSKTGDQVWMSAMVSAPESSAEAPGTYSVISPADVFFQPSGNTTPIKNCDNFDPQAETYSEITPIAAPPERSGSSKAKENSGCSESDVYHMYCTIPDLHVTPIQNDAVYSLLQKH